MKTLRSYMASAGDPSEGAVLVFAYTAAEAKRLAFPAVRDWTNCDYIEVRVKWLRSGCEHMRQKDGPHVVYSPPSCDECELWWEEPLVDGLCESCREDREWDAELTVESVRITATAER